MSPRKICVFSKHFKNRFSQFTSKPKKWPDFVYQPYHLSSVCCAQTTICGNACVKVLMISCFLKKKNTPTDHQWGKGCSTKLYTHFYINKVNIGGCNCCNPLTNIPIPDIVKETVVNADNSPRPAGERIIEWKGRATNRRKTLPTTGWLANPRLCNSDLILSLKLFLSDSFWFTKDRV